VKNADLWASYGAYTGELTKFARQLAFAGAAICWFFRTPDVRFPSRINAALLAFVTYFVLDIAQYFSAALLLRFWIRAEESRRWASSDTLDGEYDKPAWLDEPPFVLFVLKIVALVIAFAMLASEFLVRM
jgi:hypothetical protein